MVYCKIPRENMSPFLTCFPHLPFGKALRAGTHSARARKSTSPHYATRCVGAKKITAHPQLRTLVWCLALASVVAAAPPNSVFEKVSAF